MDQELGYQLAYQRGVQAVIWGMPAVSLACLREATFHDLGARYNDIVYMSNVTEPRHELLTADHQSLYVMVMLNLKHGPVVLEVPPATEKVSFRGSAVDSWMVPIADIGPAGADAGEGGKYLFLPPGYKEEAPAGYLAMPSKTYGVHVAVCPALSPKGTLANAVAYAKRLRAYPLAQADSPANRYIDAYMRAWRALPAYDMSYFEALAEVIDDEPLQEKDAAMIGLLASIGIKKGTPFLPEGKLARALELAVKDGRRQMEHYFETPGLALTPYRPSGQWMVGNVTPHDGATYLVDGKLLIDERAGGYSYWSTFAPKRQDNGTYCLYVLRDSSGQLLKGAGLYRLQMPREVPAQLWSVTVYGKESKAYIHNDSNRVGVASYDQSLLRMNIDGSVDLYFGPQAPAGKEPNWIPTANRDFFLIVRLYGAEKAVFDRSFKLPDLEKVA